MSKHSYILHGILVVWPLCHYLLSPLLNVDLAALPSLQNLDLAALHCPLWTIDPIPVSLQLCFRLRVVGCPWLVMPNMFMVYGRHRSLPPARQLWRPRLALERVQSHNRYLNLHLVLRASSCSCVSFNRSYLCFRSATRSAARMMSRVLVTRLSTSQRSSNPNEMKLWKRHVFKDATHI
jgi:hypothetical protein